MRMPKRKNMKGTKGHSHKRFKVCFSPCRCFSVGKKTKFKFKEVS